MRHLILLVIIPFKFLKMAQSILGFLNAYLITRLLLIQRNVVQLNQLNQSHFPAVSTCQVLSNQFPAAC
jgi:hypothetical protein